MTPMPTQTELPATPTQTASPTPSLKPTQSAGPVVKKNEYPVHENIFTTMFWVGEKADGSNDYIPNEASAWDSHWMGKFGGIDNPYSRNGYSPSGFNPKQNPFYFALPYNDFGDNGRKANATKIPWYRPGIGDRSSYVKNRLIKITYKSKTCYAQWEDVGPFETDDFDYVFGTSEPKEKRAGLDVSPAVRTCLQMLTNDNVSWQFVEDTDVPSGPWKEIVTTSQVDW